MYCGEIAGGRWKEEKSLDSIAASCGGGQSLQQYRHTRWNVVTMAHSEAQHTLAEVGFECMKKFLQY